MKHSQRKETHSILNAASLLLPVIYPVWICSHLLLFNRLEDMSVELLLKVREELYIASSAGLSKRSEGSRWTILEGRRLRPGGLRG